MVCNDTSCSEVAAREGVSRQSIHELVRKCDRQMDVYEEKLHMMERFLRVKDHVTAIRKEAEAMTAEVGTAGAADVIRQLCDQILEEL